MHQPMLFELPSSPDGPDGRLVPTADQVRMLDFVALREGLALGEIGRWDKVVLRHLMAAGLVVCVALGPAVYALTPVGRLVRGRCK